MVFIKADGHANPCLGEDMKILVYFGAGILVSVFQKVCLLVEPLQAYLLDMGFERLLRLALS